jgi:putative iron-dependent peroxidase
MSNFQAGILTSVPKLARYIEFSLVHGADPRDELKTLAVNIDTDVTVIGLGLSLVQQLNVKVNGLKVFPAQVTTSIEIPSTPMALWCWLKGDDRGEILHRARKITHLLGPAFKLENTIDAFMYGESQDLSGYIDGTENPVDTAAMTTAFVGEQEEGLNGSSFVAVQKWVHNLDVFESFSVSTQDNIIGRRISDNEEIDDAPDSAHVKRTAQESFTPEAFILRRSMPWAKDNQQGLVFVAFGHSFDAFEAQLNRMTGSEDGIQDALFRFTLPVSGSYFWCPPAKDNRLDLSYLKIK